MKHRYSTLIAIVALVGLFTAGRVEAVDVRHADLQRQHTDLQNQHNAQQTQHTDLQRQNSQHHFDLQNQLTALQSQLTALQSQLEQIPPAWSQALPADKRFVLVLGDAAVLDKETGLVWERTPSTIEREWGVAQVACNRKVTGGRHGWGLPTIQQLTSLLRLPDGHPFILGDVTLTTNFWSATSLADTPDLAWAANSITGEAGHNASKTFFVNFRAWCVRGGHGGPDAR